jgi:hypothetical protein
MQSYLSVMSRGTRSNHVAFKGKVIEVYPERSHIRIPSSLRLTDRTGHYV